MYMIEKYKNNVLFVDDEANILNALKRSLRNEGYNKYFATSGKEALEIIREMDIHVIVTDMKMPFMSGLEMLNEVRTTYPEIMNIVLSGYSQMPQVLATINQVDIFKFITKPWDSEQDLKLVIDEAINIYNYKTDNEVLKNSIAKKNEAYQKLLCAYSVKHENLKRDFLALYSIQNKVTNYLIDLNEKRIKELINPSYYSEILTKVNAYNEMFKNIYPTELISIPIKELSKRLFSNKNIKIELFNSNELSQDIQVNIKLLILMMKIIFNELFTIQKAHKIINISVDKNYKHDNGFWTNINFYLPQLVKQQNSNSDLDDLHDQIIDAMIRRFDGTYSIKKKKNNYDLRFTIKVKVDE